jgi:hypothetical protein
MSMHIMVDIHRAQAQCFLFRRSMWCHIPIELEYRHTEFGDWIQEITVCLLVNHKEPREVFNIAIVSTSPDTRHNIIRV